MKRHLYIYFQIYAKLRMENYNFFNNQEFIYYFNIT